MRTALRTKFFLAISALGLLAACSSWESSHHGPFVSYSSNKDSYPEYPNGSRVPSSVKEKKYESHFISYNSSKDEYPEYPLESKRSPSSVDKLPCDGAKPTQFHSYNSSKEYIFEESKDSPDYLCP